MAIPKYRVQVKSTSKGALIGGRNYGTRDPVGFANTPKEALAIISVYSNKLECLNQHKADEVVSYEDLRKLVLLQNKETEHHQKLAQERQAEELKAAEALKAKQEAARSPSPQATGDDPVPLTDPPQTSDDESGEQAGSKEGESGDDEGQKEEKPNLLDLTDGDSFPPANCTNNKLAQFAAKYGLADELKAAGDSKSEKYNWLKAKFNL